MNNFINYLIKFVIIAFGIVIFFNIVELDMPDTTRQVLGVIVLLFGIYRIVIFRSKKSQYRFEVNKGEEDDEE